MVVRAGADVGIPNDEGLIPYEVCVNSAKNFLAPVIDTGYDSDLDSDYDSDETDSDDSDSE